MNTQAEKESESGDQTTRDDKASYLLDPRENKCETQRSNGESATNKTDVYNKKQPAIILKPYGIGS